VVVFAHEGPASSCCFVGNPNPSLCLCLPAAPPFTPYFARTSDPATKVSSLGYQSVHSSQIKLFICLGCTSRLRVFVSRADNVADVLRNGVDAVRLMVVAADKARADVQPESI
jgi:hypothetical protein